MGLERIYVRFRHTAGFEPPEGSFLTVQLWDCCGPYQGELPALPPSDRRLWSLALRFLDVDPDTPGRHLCGYVGEENGRGFGRGIKPEAARELWRNLVQAIDAGAASLVIHCAAGRSRSASAAMAVADRLGLPRSAIDWRPQDGDFNRHVGDAPPNRHVYRVVYDAFPGA